MSFTGLFLPLGLIAALIAWPLAGHKGRNPYRWSVVCFLFFPALIALIVVKARQRAGDTPAFRERWTTLSVYDPDVRAAVERLGKLGPSAIDQFRLAYADVQTKDAIPLIVGDLEARWSAGDRFDGVWGRVEGLDALRRQGQISDEDYADQVRRLKAPRRSNSLWAGWWWKLPLVLLLLWLVWPRGGVAGVPMCESSASRDLVRRAIEGADDNRLVNRRLLTLDRIQELSFDAAAQDRACSGSAVLNSGERFIVWRLYRRGDQILASVSGF